MTPAAKHLLRCLRAYGQLYRALGRHRAGTVWQATTQLFDRFLAATFVLMSGVSIDALVLQVRPGGRGRGALSATGSAACMA